MDDSDAESIGEIVEVNDHHDVIGDDEEDKVSISQIFHIGLFCTKVFCVALL